MAKKMLIDATHPEELRVVVADGTKVDEFDFESMTRRQLAGNIYLAKVTRVEPSLQAAFVDYGGNRHGFLAFSEVHPDYYQIPKEDRDAILAEELAAAEAEAMEAEAEEKPAAKKRGRRRKKQPDAPAESPSEAAQEAEYTQADSQDAPVEDATETVVIESASEPDSQSITPADDTPQDNAGEGNTDKPASIAEDTGLDDAVVEGEPEDPSHTASIPGMDVMDLEETEASLVVDDTASQMQASQDEQPEAKAEKTRSPRRRNRKAKGEAEAAPAEESDTVEVVSESDVSEEVRPARRQRARRYKIQEVIKVRQIMLVQVVKEERGNKGAAVTTYLSLAGRYCVLMPNTARGGGISRKITNIADRKKLKEIANEIDVPKGAGLIIRTAGAKRTKSDIKRDYEYLQRQWESIRELTLKSTAPAPIYEEGNLIRRSIRDLYSKEIDEVLVEGYEGYREAKDFMKMIMPSHAKNVKHHTDPMPLFAQYQVENTLSGMFNPTVQLKSGGYIVIGITEALVSVDVNSGKATKEGSIEETALKTNLEAADELARQMRLRDLAGLIVIDFIDMDERRNNSAVEKRMKDALKDDRARIQMGRISGFGLMEMSRQRLRPGMLEATTQPCPHCHGTGLVRSDDTMALQVLRALEEEGARKRSREVLLKLPVSVANYVINDKREHLAQIETRYGMSVRIEADVHLVAPDYSLEKFKTATRIVPKAKVVSMDQGYAEIEEAEEILETPSNEAPDQPEASEEQPRKKRRRTRRRRGGKGAEAEAQTSETVSETSEGEAAEQAQDVEAPSADDESKSKKRGRSRNRTRSRRKEEPAETTPETPAEPASASEETVVKEVAEEPAPADTQPQEAKPEQPQAAPKKRPRARAKAPAHVETVQTEAVRTDAVRAEPVMQAGLGTPVPISEKVLEPQMDLQADADLIKEAEAMVDLTQDASPEASVEAQPKKRGWWRR